MDKTKIHKMWIADQGDGTYINPILYTDYSDPDAIRVGEDYFMIASSFCNTPAVPLLHSKDLVNWKVINYIIDKLPLTIMTSRYTAVVPGHRPSVIMRELITYLSPCRTRAS